jgi:predicted glycoside hydrolase/deacetylase ChbG (UPF0249 family)
MVERLIAERRAAAGRAAPPPGARTAGWAAPPAAGVRRLIVNADDLGLSPAVNRGIVELHAAGVVTSASLLMNLPATADALALTAGSDLDIGVHLNLSTGRPLARGVGSLVGPDGAFRRPPAQVCRLLAGRLRLDEVEREWAAQIEACLATGRRPAHLDSHAHLHALPGLTGVALRLARRYAIGAVRLNGHGLVVRQALPLLPRRLVGRWRLPPGPAAGAPLLTSDHLLLLTAMGRRVSPDDVAAVLRDLEPGLTELVIHPGYVDAELRRLDPLTWQRERELRLLRATWWRPLLAELGLQPTTFRAELAGAGSR